MRERSTTEALVTLRRRRVRPQVMGRRAEVCSLRCQDVGRPMCQRDMACCRGMAECGFARKLNAGDILHDLGHTPSGVHQVLSGLVGLVMLDLRGRQALVDLVRPGQVTGLDAFIGNKPHTCQALALTACEVWSAPQSAATLMYNQNQAFRNLLYGELVNCLDRARNSAQRAMTGTIADRLVWLIWELGQQVGTPLADGSLHVPLSLPYNDFATLMGHPPESLSRTLSKLAKEGRISFDRTSVVLKPETLNTLEDEVEWL